MKRKRMASTEGLSLVTEKKKVTVRNNKSIDMKKRKAGLLSYKNIKYDPSMCDKVVELMEEGKSLYVVAHELGVVTSTLENWERTYEEFAEALHLGAEASQAWWEEQARTNLIMHEKDTRFNVQIWTFNMKNRFKWADKPEEKEKSVVQELEEKKSEIKAREDDIQHTAEVLEILRGIGAVQSLVNKSAETETDEIHKTGTDS